MDKLILATIVLTFQNIHSLGNVAHQQLALFCCTIYYIPKYYGLEVEVGETDVPNYFYRKFFSADFIHMCPGVKPDCLKKTIQETIPQFVKGIPELGIIPLDPLHQNNIHIVLPGDLKIEFNDGYVYGIRKCVIDSAKYSFENAVSDLILHCNITVKGKYKAFGKILILNINGEGDAKLKATNVILKCKIKFEDVIRDGIVYHEIKHFNVRHEFGDRVQFDLSNLFQGSPEISKTVLNFLNENWKQVADELGGPIVDTIVGFVKNAIKRFFRYIPKNELINAE